MKKIAVAVMMALASQVSLADSDTEVCTGSQSCGGTGANSKNVTVTTTITNSPTITNTANGGAGGLGGAGGQGGQGGQGGKGGVGIGGAAFSSSSSKATAPTTVAPVQAVTFNSPKVAASASAPAMNATASCRVGVSAGVGGIFGSVSGGGSYLDEHCDTRELGRLLIESARIAQSLGADSAEVSKLFNEGLSYVKSTAPAAPAKEVDGDAPYSLKVIPAPVFPK